MVVIAGLEAVVIVLIVFLFMRDRRAAEAMAVSERRELLERIQRPERIPATEPVAFMVPDVEPDELELIGTIADPKEDDLA